MALVPDDPKQRNAFLVGLVALAVMYFFWDMWYTPRGEELEQLEDQNRRAQILATRGGEQMQERLALYQRHVTQLEQLIPQSEEVPQLLNDMTVEARRVNVDIALMRPEPPEPGEFYTRQSYQLEAVGEYHDVARFLTAVASLSRIITPVDMDVTRLQGNRG
ncbi:MAG: type 4a pilus biogenesis protein PilO, partial [Gemmatimonadetes bacterium]|nr:type 4a pilus biogenesis protein PilO [Gemmatimonadota bacterium]NIR80898.1 type 4a pilus biogenesis protein PilO [Gemmatimonadota bacterium]NIT88560.1 type 4a pilus biogenesis protein PilO [Gemmatimonadota bacterium]NIU33501.1 type 4a pilus biogenesis protein PilO [Gemmatimonadota bacterium]NIV63832.1 type 4a pilus biogenesis protein PilO [Gemmatimonadota bacterium]